MPAIDIGFELSNLCNLHCTHCIRGSHQPHIDRLDFPLFRRVLDEARALFDPVGVVFTGGEPLASELFADAVSEVAARSLSYRFVTNGWLLPRHLPLLLRHPPAFARISLSGATERTHDAARGRGSFRRALLGAAVLLSRNLRAELSMVVTRDSRFELEAAVGLAGSLGVPEIHFILPQPTPETARDDTDLSAAEWNDVSREVTQLARTAPLTVGLDYGAHTAMPRSRCRTMALDQLYVDALGRVPFCCPLARYGSGPEPILGDLRTEALSDVVARARETYQGFGEETVQLHRAGRWDAFDDFPCLSCARRHGQTAFLAGFPQHPWAQLARRPA